MNFQLIILRIYFKFISLFSTRSAASAAFKLFQKVRIKAIREREKEFFEKARHFKVPSGGEDLFCYEFSPENNNLVFFYMVGSLILAVFLKLLIVYQKITLGSLVLIYLDIGVIDRTILIFTNVEKPLSQLLNISILKHPLMLWHILLVLQ